MINDPPGHFSTLKSDPPVTFQLLKFDRRSLFNILESIFNVEKLAFLVIGYNDPSYLLEIDPPVEI